MRKAIVNRNDVLITSKVYHFPAGISLNNIELTCTGMGNKDADIKKEVRVAIEKSLYELGLGFIDCMLMHWPSNPEKQEDGELCR